MAAKYIHLPADESNDLQKQIGRTKGVFQIFNRHHVSRTRGVERSSKRDHPGNVTPEREPTVEKHRVSSGDSFSYLDYNIDNHQSVDYRGVVKGSTYREECGLSRKTIMENDLDNWYCEPRELSRSKSCQSKDEFSLSVDKDYPRFSYDGREADFVSINKDFKLTNPRLVLDSTERSVRTLSSVSLVPVKPSNLSRSPKFNADKDLSQTRPPSVVAKLMGLETYPSSKSLNSSNHCGLVNKMPNSTKPALREPTSPCWKNVDRKPISRVPVEPAPWKQRDGTRAITSSTKIHGPVSNVYSDVDKRLKNLEFADSGKDLRALKQILEAMHAVEARSSDHNNHQNKISESKEPGMSLESNVVIKKPAKKGCINNKTGRSLVIESTRGEMRSRQSIPLTSSSKPGKQSNKPHLEARTRRQSSKPTREVGEVLTPENPSPVSVLDDSAYVDNSPSPVKRMPINKKDVTPNPTNIIVKDRCDATNDVQPKTITSFQITRDKLKKVEDLVAKLKNLNSSHDESTTDYIKSLCENTNPNNTYISQILLASGLLLRDLKSFKFHLSGHPINPELFSVLEHTKFKNSKKGKSHRKLIFDAVNEILVGKLGSSSRTMIMQITPRMLLRELCLEIEQLQVPKKRDECGPTNEDDYLKSILLEDLLKKSEKWAGFYGESAVIGMEVEQLIFRDLVNEVVMSRDWR